MFTWQLRQSRCWSICFFKLLFQSSSGVHFLDEFLVTATTKFCGEYLYLRRIRYLCFIVDTETMTHLLYSDGFLVCYLQNQKAICRQIFTDENWDLSIGTANRPRTGQPWSGGIAGRTKEFCPLDSVHAGSGTHSAFFSLNTRYSSPAVKRPGREAPSRARLRIYEVNLPLSHNS
jgi:hypothetical protein